MEDPEYKLQNKKRPTLSWLSRASHCCLSGTDTHQYTHHNPISHRLEASCSKQCQDSNIASILGWAALTQLDPESYLSLATFFTHQRVMTRPTTARSVQWQHHGERLREDDVTGGTSWRSRTCCLTVFLVLCNDMHLFWLCHSQTYPLLTNTPRFGGLTLGVAFFWKNTIYT